MLELGGFAESPRVLGGDERDYEAYNYCLAENYYHTFLDEDFEALGEIDSYLVEDIIFWLNYNGKIGKDKEKRLFFDIIHTHNGCFGGIRRNGVLGFVCTTMGNARRFSGFRSVLFL